MYWSALNYEYKTEERPNTPGAKPRVDYLITGQMSDRILYQIPVESKKKNTLGDMGQLAHYMSTLGRDGFFQKTTGIGLVLDESTVYFAFTPLILQNDEHLPIVLLSPKVTWRNGTCINLGKHVPHSKIFK